MMMGLLASAGAAQEKKKKVDVEALFKKLDANNDGKLNKDEFLKLADNFKEKDKARERLGQVFDKIDPKMEGISRDQFRKYIDSVSVKKKDKDKTP
jgi:Ca2+-binding EF-hand superfamily protein